MAFDYGNPDGGRTDLAKGPGLGVRINGFLNILITSYCHLADYTPELTSKSRNIQLTKINDKIDVMELHQEADIWHIY
jgi:hypothetical protein